MDNEMDEWGKKADKMLECYVIAINTGYDYPLWVTLLLGGTLVSGQMISVDEYNNGVGGFPAFSADGEYIEGLLNEGSVRPPQYIHLKEARYLAPGSTKRILAKQEGVFFRARLSSVDGFHVDQK